MTTRFWSLAADVVRRARADAGGDARLSPLPGNDAKTIIAVQQALVRRRSQLGFRHVAIRVVGLAAAAASLVLAARLLPHSTPLAAAPPSRTEHRLSVLESAQQGKVTKAVAAVIGDGSGSRSATDGMTLQTGIRLLAPPDGEVRIGSGDGTVLTLETNGELAVVEQSATRKFSLRTGAVRAQVAKLQNNERFIIATADAEVEVHGTTFRVSMSDGDPRCANGVRTRVSVFEGVVSVRVAGSESYVPAGATWPSCAAGPSASGGTASLPPPTVTVGSNRAAPSRGLARKRAAVVSQPDGGALVPHFTPPSAVDPRASSRDAETSGLAVANDLFAAAVQAKRQERPTDAVRLFSRLIETAPDNPLVEGARVQKMKLLARLDRGAARKAALEYLEFYPQGFARDDARRLVGTAP